VAHYRRNVIVRRVRCRAERQWQLFRRESYFRRVTRLVDSSATRIPIISSSILSFPLNSFFFHGIFFFVPFTYSAALSFCVSSESLPSPRSNFERLHISDLYAKPRHSRETVLCILDCGRSARNGTRIASVAVIRVAVATA